MRMGILSFVASLYIFVGGLGFLLNITAAVFLINKHHHTIPPLAIYGLSDTLAGTVAGIGLFIDGCLYFANLTYSSTCYRYFLIYTLLMFPLVTSNFSALGVAIERYRAIVNLERSENIYKLFSVVWTMVSWFIALAFVIVLWGHTELRLKPVTHDSTFHWEYENDYRHSRGLPEDIWSQNSQSDWSSNTKEDIVVGIVKGIVLTELSKHNKSKTENNVNKEEINKFLHQVQTNYGNVFHIHTSVYDIETQTNNPKEHVTKRDENNQDYYSYALKTTEGNIPKETTSISTKKTIQDQNTPILFHTNDKHINHTFLPHATPSLSQLYPINSSKSSHIDDPGNLSLTEVSADGTLEKTIDNSNSLHTLPTNGTTKVQSTIPITQKQVTLSEPSPTTILYSNNFTKKPFSKNLTSQTILHSVLAATLPTMHEKTSNSRSNTTNFQDTKISQTGINSNEIKNNASKTVTYSNGIEMETKTTYNSSKTNSKKFGSKDQEPFHVTTRPTKNKTMEYFTSFTNINESKSTLPEHSIPHNDLWDSSKATTPSLQSDPPYNATSMSTQDLPQLTKQHEREKPPRHSSFFTQQSYSSIPTIPPSSNNTNEDITSDMTKVCRAQPGFLKVFMTMLFVGVFAIPLLVSAGLYTRVAHVLYNHRPPNTQDSTYHQWSRTKRATVKVLSILIVYIACWTPFMVERLLYAWTAAMLLPTFVPALLFLLGHTHNLLRGVLYVFDDAQVRTTISGMNLCPCFGECSNVITPMTQTSTVISHESPFLISGNEDLHPSRYNAFFAPGNFVRNTKNFLNNGLTTSKPSMRRNSAPPTISRRAKSSHDEIISDHMPTASTVLPGSITDTDSTQNQNS